MAVGAAEDALGLDARHKARVAGYVLAVRLRPVDLGGLHVARAHRRRLRRVERQDAVRLDATHVQVHLLLLLAVPDGVRLGGGPSKSAGEEVLALP